MLTTLGSYSRQVLFVGSPQAFTDSGGVQVEFELNSSYMLPDDFIRLWLINGMDME